MSKSLWSQRQATKLMQDWKEAHPCADCHWFYRYCQMEFDHDPSLGKGFNLGTEGKRLDEVTLRREMAKCQTVCCNCHALRTWNRLRGPRLGSALPRSQGRHLPPGASLTPWTRTDETIEVKGLSCGSVDRESGALRTRANPRTAPVSRLRGGQGDQPQASSRRLFR